MAAVVSLVMSSSRVARSTLPLRRLRIVSTPVSPLESALADELRVLAEIGRSCLFVSPLRSAPTNTAENNPFRIRTYGKIGAGDPTTGPLRSIFLHVPTARDSRNSLPFNRMRDFSQKHRGWGYSHGSPTTSHGPRARISFRIRTYRKIGGGGRHAI